MWSTGGIRRSIGGWELRSKSMPSLRGVGWRRRLTSLTKRWRTLARLAAGSGFGGRPHPPNSPTTVIATVTQTAAPSVIQMPTLAMSRMEK